MKNGKELPSWLLVAISLVFAIYLLVLFHLTTNLAKPESIQPIHYFILFLGVLLPLVPFIQRLKLGQLVELEKEVKSTKEEVREFKNEIRQMISIINTSINTMTNLHNTTNVSIDFSDLLRQAKESLKKGDDVQQPQEVEEIKEELLLEDEDNVMALARTRIRIEYLLRKILSKRTFFSGQKDIKLMSAGRLYRIFLKEYPEYKYLEQTFDYVLKICNAAVHGQQVPFGQTQEALELGARLISILKEIAGLDGERNHV